MRLRPISPVALVAEIADRIVAGQGRLRVMVDGAPAARPGELADALVGPLRTLGREVLRVSVWDFLRPASLRYEYGRHDPDTFYDDWLDLDGLVREVLAPLDPGGTGKVLPSLWDAALDRATRAQYTFLPPGGVLLLDGALLLGRGLPIDLSVHLNLSPGALARRTPAEDEWTLPAYARYEQEARPLHTADIAVRADDPRHPAILID